MNETTTKSRKYKHLNEIKKTIQAMSDNKIQKEILKKTENDIKFEMKNSESLTKRSV